MNYNLTIDQGNSSAKVSLFLGKDIISVQRYDNLTIDNLSKILQSVTIQRAIYSSVREKDVVIEDFLAKSIDKLITLDYNTPMPMSIDYATPASLGHDRIAAAVGAMGQAKGHSVMIIDAGTAITLDIVSHDGRFVGGRISPGLKMRFEALNSYTSKLPLVNEAGDIPNVGYDTQSSIRAGVVGGLVDEIDGYIAQNSEIYHELMVFMTGGDCRFLSEQIKSHIFVDENLLAKGLNRILSYNESI